MQTALNEQIVTVLPDGRMDTKNAAIYAGLAEKTMAMMRGKGVGPAYVKMGRIFYFKNEIDEWINGRIVKTA
jgi:hypothetical protein